MALRGTNIAQYLSTSSATISVTLPAGCVAGDLAILMASSTQYNGTTISVALQSGWSLLWNSLYQTISGSKVLDSTDISNGSIAVTTTGIDTYDSTISVVVFVGAPTIREADGSDMNTPGTITTSGSVIAGDAAIYFGNTRTYNSICLSRGVQLQLAKNGSPSLGTGWGAGIYAEGITVPGAYSVGFSNDNSTSAIPEGYDGLIVIVESESLPPGAPSLSLGPPTTGTVGIPYSNHVTPNNLSCTIVYSLTSGSLPPGLSLSSSGVITGTPTTLGVYPFTVTADYGAVFGSGPLPFSVSGPLTITIGSGISISCDSPPVGAIGVPYTHTFPISSGVPPYTFSIISGSLPTGLVLDASTGVVSGTPVSSGTFPFTIQVTDSTTTSASVDCSIIINAALSITCNNPPLAMSGIAYSHAFPATGGIDSYAFAIISGSLPPGMVLDPATGIVSGTSTVVGTYPFTIQVTDMTGTHASVACSIQVIAQLSALCNNPPQGVVGRPYTHQLGASGGVPPYTYSILSGSLPPGLNLNTMTGLINGTPTSPGTFPFTVQVTDSTSATAICSITIIVVAPPPPLSAGCPLATGNAASPYNGQLPAAGGLPPYTYTIISGALPDGLTLDNATGAISGTPDIMGTSAFTWQLADSAGNTLNTGCSIQILCPTSYINGAKFQLWGLKFVTEPADKAEVTHSYDFDSLGHPYDKRLTSIMFEYNGEFGDIVMQMETIVGIGGITAGPVLTFPLPGTGRSLTQFGIDGLIAKSVRLSPTTAPNVNWRGWKYIIEKENYPPDFVLTTPKNIFGYACEKIATVLELDIDTGGIGATVSLYADGNLLQTVPVNTTVNDRSRIIALNPNLIGREFWLELHPGQGGKTQLFSWNIQYVKEPCAITFFSTYEQRFGYAGYKWIRMIWVAYQAANPVTLQIFVDGGNLFWTQTLPAHPNRDEERFYLPAIDVRGEFLNKSKTYVINMTATSGTMKVYSDSWVEWVAIGVGQRVQRFLLTEREQMPVS